MLRELNQDQVKNLLVIINNADVKGKDAEYISTLKRSLLIDVTGQYKKIETKEEKK